MSTLISSSKYLPRAIAYSSIRCRPFSASGTIFSRQSGLLNEPVGVQAALRASEDSSFIPHPTLFSKEFSLSNRVAIVTGGQRGLGLEMASALAEAGATVYCLDRPAAQDADPSFKATKEYVSRLGLPEKSRLEYVSLDVTDQKSVWGAIEEIAGKEGRLDVCVAAAGIVHVADSLNYSAKDFQALMDVNVNGVLYTAQAAGRQMVKFDNPGSIILIASMYGSVANKQSVCIGYNISKSAVLQMGRSLACELGLKGIRVNTLSPGFIKTDMIKPYPELHDVWAAENPLGRIGNPSELRGVVTWLASDASSFCTGSDIIVCGGHHAW